VFHFTVVKPAAGVEAPHLDVTIFARGLLRHLATRMYFPDEETANASDRILSLIDPAHRHTLIAHPEGQLLRFDIRLQGESETVFFAL
jgi:protocatechuate 3,4-dioxygenase alpha subunit